MRLPPMTHYKTRTEMEAILSPLRTLAYTSKAARDVNDADLRALFARAAEYNGKLDVTGLLLFADGVFIQTIEGHSDDVADVLLRIRNDKSHRVESIFVDETVVCRVYPGWAMMASLFPVEATLVSFLNSRSESPTAAFTRGQLEGIRRTLDFVNQRRHTE